MQPITRSASAWRREQRSSACLVNLPKAFAPRTAGARELRRARRTVSGKPLVEVRQSLKVTRLGLDWLWSRVRWHCSYYSWRRTRIVGRGPKTEIACSLRRFEWRIRTRADPGSNRLARAAQCVGKRVCPINATVDSYWRSSSSPTTARAPHQFRTRNGLAKTQRTRSISNENSAKSTKPTIIPSLITVWLSVRVLPGSVA